MIEALGWFAAAVGVASGDWALIVCVGAMVLGALANVVLFLVRRSRRGAVTAA